MPLKTNNWSMWPSMSLQLLPFPVAFIHHPLLELCPAQGEEGVPFLQQSKMVWASASAHCSQAAGPEPLW